MRVVKNHASRFTRQNHVSPIRKSVPETGRFFRCPGVAAPVSDSLHGGKDHCQRFFE
jgi:hypothetical protein